jgi:hypothetical protein
LNEFLQTLRGIHRLLLIFCLTVLAFLLTSKPNTAGIESALEEIAALKKLEATLGPYRQIFDDYYGTLRPFDTGEIKWTKVDVDEKERAKNEAAERAEDLKKHQQTLAQCSDSSEVDDDSLSYLANSCHLIRYEAPPLERSFKEIAEFLEGRTRYSGGGGDACTEIVIPHHDITIMHLRSFIRTMHEQHKNFTINKLRIVAPEINWDYYAREPKSGDQYKRLKEGLDRDKRFAPNGVDDGSRDPSKEKRRSDEPPDIYVVQFEADFTLKDDPKKAIQTFRGNSFIVDSIGGGSLVSPKNDPHLNRCMEWLRSKGGFEKLYVESVDGSRIWLPKLRPFWSQISDQTIDGADTLLSDRLFEKRTTASFGGITFDATAISLLAPITTACLLLYLGVYLRRCSIVKRTTAATTGDFPWIALFDDWPSRILSYASVAVLPLVVNIWLLLKTPALMAAFPHGSAAISVVLAILVILAAAFASYQLAMLRKA